MPPHLLRNSVLCLKLCPVSFFLQPDSLLPQATFTQNCNHQIFSNTSGIEYPAIGMPTMPIMPCVPLRFIQCIENGPVKHSI